jgi:magnesium transporter
MVTRGMAVGGVVDGDYKKVVWKELRIGFFVGLALGVANFTRLVIYYSAKGEMASTNSLQYLWISFGASISLFIVILFAKFVGGTLPLIAKKINIDPAVMAAPLLTTLIDALSTLIFFGVNIGILLLTVI